MTHPDPQPHDLDALLLRERIVLVTAALDAEQAGRVIARLLYLDAVEPGEEIRLYLNSPGGEAAAGLAVYDTIRALLSDVRTVAVGEVAGTAALVLAAGAPGKRHALPSARVTWLLAGGDRDAELQAALGLALPPGAPVTAAQAVGFGIIDAIWRQPVRQLARAQPPL
ncbi:MAG: ATP-dependent Clp protease proteolytic subunit [Cyanobacteria bacterium RYN_339]|nr:ATP-dependent Clp protease proteolytic subunit [Cyanobacteria bacterium RYN_339]